MSKTQKTPTYQRPSIEHETATSSPIYDAVEKPKHYNIHPSGIECIRITEHMGFCLGNVIKYVWRSDEKNGVEDLKKAVWYLQREISRRGTNDPSDR